MGLWTNCWLTDKHNKSEVQKKKKKPDDSYCKKPIWCGFFGTFLLFPLYSSPHSVRSLTQYPITGSQILQNKILATMTAGENSVLRYAVLFHFPFLMLWFDVCCNICIGFEMGCSQIFITSNVAIWVFFFFFLRFCSYWAHAWIKAGTLLIFFLKISDEWSFNFISWFPFLSLVRIPYVVLLWLFDIFFSIFFHCCSVYAFIFLCVY